MENSKPKSHSRMSIAQKAKKEIRLQKVEKMILNGVTAHSEIAAAFGVSRHTVMRWMKEIYERWKNDKPNEIEQCRNLRRAQLEGIFQQAMVSFEKSKLPGVEETTEKVRCSNCGGEGTVEESPGSWEKCEKCEGKRFVTIKLTKKRKTSIGDATFLRVAKDVVTEIAKIEGVVSPEHSRLISTKLLQTANSAGNDLQSEIHDLYIEAPQDTIIKAMVILEELELSRQRSQKKNAPTGTRENPVGTKIEVIDANKQSQRKEGDEDPGE